MSNIFNWLRPSFWKMSPTEKLIHQLKTGKQTYETECLLVTATTRDQVELGLKLLELQRKYGKVDPETATIVERSIQKEPYGEIIIEYKEDGFELKINHNPYLIEALKNRGYRGSEQEITEQWMLDVCRSILTDDGVEALEYLTTGAEPSVVRSDDGKVTYS